LGPQQKRTGVPPVPLPSAVISATIDMNDRKLKQLFASARKETAPAPTEDFADNVLRAIRREPPAAKPEAISIFDQLNLWFPRIALAASAAIVVCIALDYGMTAAGVPSLSDGVSQLSSQWLLTPPGL
jgi:anti-sigma-K factor RskA